MISLIGLILLIVITVLVYKTAKDYGRNAVLWAAINFVAGFSIQIILPGFILFIIAAAATVGGSSTQQIQDDIPIVTISIVCIFLSIAAGFLVIRHLGRTPEEDLFDAPPAPPSDLNQKS